MSKHLLFLDTSATETRVTLFRDTEILSEKTHPDSRDHGLYIHQFVDAVCVESGKNLQELDGIVVMNGPGSYTGLRIALSVAKGFCYALGKPLFLLNKLDVCALATLSILPQGKRAIAVQARNNEFFFCCYDKQGIRQSEPEIVDLVFLNAIEEPIFSFQSEITPILPHCTILELNSNLIGHIALMQVLQGKEADMMHAEPFYLKNVYINKINKL